MAFPALVTTSPAMDRVHGHYLYRAPSLLLRCYVVTLPAKIFRGRGPGHNGKEKLSTFQAKADEAIFLGYSNTSKAFKVLNLRTKKFEIGRAHV